MVAYQLCRVGKPPGDHQTVAAGALPQLGRRADQTGGNAVLPQQLPRLHGMGHGGKGDDILQIVSPHEFDSIPTVTDYAKKEEC